MHNLGVQFFQFFYEADTVRLRNPNTGNYQVDDNPVYELQCLGTVFNFYDPKKNTVVPQQARNNLKHDGIIVDNHYSLHNSHSFPGFGSIICSSSSVY